MDFNHRPVLLDECIESLDIKPDGVYIDGTLGGAGHSAEILKRLGQGGALIGLDQDSFALGVARERLESSNAEAKLIFANTNFVNMKKVCTDNGIAGVDGILLDLGVSSYQLDEGERGFSYMHDAPLDMRMDRKGTLDAGIIVNEYPQHEIRKIISEFGEEKWASRIAEFIVEARSRKRIDTTYELVEIIKAAIPSSARREGPHPAKRTFQALRIAVNDELGVLKRVIGDGTGLLKKGGRFCIITFHSLEDRIVKEEFGRCVNPCTCPPQFPVCTCGKKPVAEHVTRKPIVPSKEELEGNPRSRSSKLRVIRKI